MGVRYLTESRNGVFWYYRRIPKELRSHYGKDFIRKSLSTREPHVAAKKVAALAAADDALWASLRSPQAAELGLTTQQNRHAAEALLATLGLARGDIHHPRRGDHAAEALDDHFASRHGKKYLDIRHDEYRSTEDMLDVLTPAEREAFRLRPAKGSGLIPTKVGLSRHSETTRWDVPQM